MSADPQTGTSEFTSKRMQRELKTISAMISLYCKAHHNGGKNKLCSQCEALVDHATARLAKCPFQDMKTTCANCTVHCYSSEPKKQVKDVMRYSGPRMIFHHPYLALLHVLDGWRNASEKRINRRHI